MHPILEAFQRGDVYLDYPYEDLKFRYDKAANQLYARFYGKPEAPIPQSDAHFNEAISAGKQISREEYFRD